jgi:hypothetical protein
MECWRWRGDGGGIGIGTRLCFGFVIGKLSAASSLTGEGRKAHVAVV